MLRHRTVPNEFCPVEKETKYMRKNNLGKRILATILVLVMVIGMFPTTVFAANGKHSGGQNGSGSNKLSFTQVDGIEADVKHPATKVEQEKEEPLYNDEDIVRVSIVMSKDATLEKYATNNIASNAEAMAYRQGLQMEQNAVVQRIETDVLAGAQLDVVWNLTLAANIISVNVAYGLLDEIAAIRGVKEVVIETQYEAYQTEEVANPLMSTASSMIGSTQAWASGYTGAGTRIAVIDTGLDLNHQSFSSQGLLYSLEQLAADKGVDAEAYIESLDLLDQAEISAVLKNLNVYPLVQYLSGTANGKYYVNEKVPFAINYVDRNYDVTHDNDQQSDHGSHVAGIAAANRYIPSGNSYENALSSVKMQGVAPDAQLVIMKVFGSSGGAYDSDYMVAIEDAILLGCDAINLSLGTDKGFVRNNTYQYILDSLAEHDVILSVAAGNSGAWPEYAINGMGMMYVEDVDYSVVGSPSAATNTMSVASAENIGMTDYYIGLGDEILFYDEAIFSTGEYLPLLKEIPGNVNYILIDGLGTAEDVAAVVVAEGGSIAPNTVFVCSRGVINFGEKANNAIAAGFVATIVYNNVDGALVMNMDGYEYSNPVVSVSLLSGMKLRNAANAVKDAQGNVLYYKGEMYISGEVTSTIVSDHYVMSDFSSWGVPGSLTMKPEITAPGGEIYSVNGIDPSGTSYYSNSGTSMAAPQVTGMAALVIQYIQETGLDTKLGVSARQLATSLLMSTAQPMKDGENYYPVLQQGSGLANVGAAVMSQSFIMMDAAATASAADGKVKVELGDDPARTGAYTFTFTLTNFGQKAQIYSISGDFFTQDVVTVDGVTYTARTTTPLNMGVAFEVEGGFIDASSAYDCDLTGDGVTDAADAQYILNYVAGLVAEISDKADLNGNGVVNTYDAHLLLASVGSGYFMVDAGEEATVTVTMTLTEEAKAHLNKTFVNGAYVEGFVLVEPLTTEEGEVSPAHSIPVLGFYGNWSDATMYDRLNYEDYVYAETNGTDMKLPYSGYTNYLTFFDEDDYEHTYVGNPYLIEETFPYDKIAIRPDMEIGDMATTLIRNAGGFMFYVEDAEGNVVDAVAAPQIRAAYYSLSAGYWYWVNSAGLSIWLTPEELGGFQEGDTFTVGFMALPEYYVQGNLSDEETLAQMLALKKSGTIGQGAYYTHTFTVDGTDPELLGVEKLENGDLKVNVKDNRHVAVVAVLTANGGTTLVKSGVDQDQVNTATELVINMEGVRINRDCLIMVADYAGNETYYLVEDYNEGLTDFVGRMYGFTNAKTRGTANSWMEIDVGALFYDGGDLDQEIHPTMGGTMDVAKTNFSVIAAEYAGEHVFMITDENELRVAAQGQWDKSLLAAVNPDYSMIRDMAYNTADGKMYVLGVNNIIYTMDLYTGALTKQYQIEIAAPEGANADGLTKKFTDENKKLLTLTIDDEGNFYAVNNGDSTYQRVYLYSWSAADVENGRITGLTPVNNTYDGYAGDYVYNDDIPATGNPAVQSMAWDHDEDVLYWAAALGSASPYNYLYIFDTKTGKATIATENPYPGTEDATLGCLCVNVSGLYIVPKETAELDTTENAKDLLLSRNEVTLLKGSKLQMQWDVLPWNLIDKSLTWTTTDQNVVTVDENGVITAVGVGTATIKATTNAAPYLFATCDVTVNSVQDVELNGMLHAADGGIEWINFNLLSAGNWTSTFQQEGVQFLAGGMHEDVIYVHDGEYMYGVDADTFEVTNYGIIHESWLWSDATTGPETPAGYFDRLVGIINGGRCIGVMDVEAGMGYEVSHYGDFTDDPAAVIAYVGPTTFHDGFELCYGHEYYIMTESGQLYHDIIYAFFDSDAQEVFYSDNLTHVGSTGLKLTGASDPTSNTFASMYYDLANDYLIVSTYTQGKSAAVYVLQPDACAPVEVAGFGTGVGPVISLYSYDALTDVTVKVKPDKAECYVGESVKLSATVYMAEFDRTVTWSSSDESIATVNSNGVVTALKAGTVTITATAKERNDAGQYATASATITVKPLAQVDVMLHAYIQTEEGGKWVVIDGNNMDQYTLAKSDAVYTGAGVVDGKIYATDENTYYMIDPAGNQYVVTKGDMFTDGDGADFLYMLDTTGAPSRTVELKDWALGTKASAAVGGMPVYLSGVGADGVSYLTILGDYATGEFAAAQLDASRYPAGIAYHYSEEIEDYWFDFYYVLGYDGYLEHFSLYSALYDGEMLLVDGGWEVDYMNTGLQFADGDDVSMIYVENEAFTGVIISHATAEGTELWCYDTENLKLSKMGFLKGVTDLVGLSLASELDIEIPAKPDVPGTVEPEEAEYIYGYIKCAEGYVWAKINTSDMTYETLYTDTNNYAWPAAGAWNGKVYTMLGVTKYGNTTYTYQELDPANGYQIDVNATGDTAFANYTATDFTGVPAVSVSMVDSTNGKTYTKTLGGYFLHTSNGKYTSSAPRLFYVQKYTQSNAETEIYTTEKTFSGPLSAVVYVGSELSADSKEFYDYFLILGQSGDLYELCLTSYLDGGTLKLNARSSVTKVATLNVKSTSGATFTRVSANCAYLSVNGANTVELYSFNLATYELKDLGKIQGAMSLVGLHSDTELAGVFEEDRPDTPVQPEPGCQHTTTKVEGAKEATCTEPGYIGDTVCADCGETVAAGEVIPAPGHSFENGVCTKCGATDPNYKPAEPADTAKWLHAYVQLASGYAWVAIDVETGAYTVIAEGSDAYDGAGVGHDGKIYATLNEKYVMIDPANGYATTIGATAHYWMPMMDATASAPAQTLELKDVKNGTMCTGTVGGYLFYGTVDYGDAYLAKMFDYLTGSAKDHEARDYFDEQIAEAMAYISSEQVDESYFHEYYLVLNSAGNLFKLTEKTRFYSGTLGWSHSSEAVAYLGLDVTNGASMTMLNETTAVIAACGASGVTVYTYDLTTNTLAKLYVLEGVTDLMGLELLSKVDTDFVPESSAPCTHANTKVEGAEEATCTEPGYTGDTVCADCGEIIAVGEVTPATGHIKVGKWQHNAAEHWQICACGVKVNQGAHNFVNGYCSTCSKPCEHTEVGQWQYNEDRHWKNCICGEYMEIGAHQFTDGVCYCGYADPNYTPAEPVDVSNWLHAYVQLETGYAWVAINVQTGEYTVIAEGSDAYDGAGVGHDGKIYATLNGKYVVIDPSNGYSVTVGGATAYDMPILDATASAPAQNVVLKDQKNGESVDVTVGGYLHYSSMDETYWPYLVKLYDSTVPTYKVKEYTGCDDTTIEAMAYISSELLEDNTFFYEHYLVLNYFGDLYKLTEQTKIHGGTLSWSRSCEIVSYLSLDVSGGASITMLNETTAVIAACGEYTVTLYSFDLTTNTLQTIATLEGVTDLMGLELLSKVDTDFAPAAPEQPEEPADVAWVHAYVQTETGYAWVKINSATGEYTVIAEGSDAYDGAGVGHDGKIYATLNGKYVVIDPSNGYSVTVGGGAHWGIPMLDGAASAPAQTLELKDTKDGAVHTGTVGGYLLYGSIDYDWPYMVKLFDYSAPTTKYAETTCFNEAMPEAVAFISAEQIDESYFYEYYLVVNSQGDLYKLTEKTRFYGGTLGWNRSAEMIADLNLNVTNGASMTMLNETTAMIAACGAAGVTVYTYDLTTNTLTTLYTLEGVTDLMGLSLLSDIAGQNAQSTKVPTGSLLSVSIASEATEPAQGENVVFADGNVTVNIAENATNGLLEITFDPAVLTYQGIYSASAFCAVNDTQAAGGKLIIAYAAATKLSAEDVLAALNFSYTGNGVHTAISVTTLERGEEAELAEKMEIVVSNCAHEQTEIVGAVEATCTEPGYTGDVCCALCGALITAGEQIPAAHRYVGALIEAPTAVATGRLSVFCAGCEDSFQLEIPALNATDYSYRVVQLPTAISDGIGRYTWKMTDYGSFSFDVIIRHEVAKTDAQIIIESKLAAAGKTVRLEVVLQNNPGIQGLIAQLRYDESVMTLVSVENGVVLGDLDQGRNLLWTADSDVMADGVLCVLEFQIAENAPMGYYPVSLVLEEAANENDEPVALHMVYANVQILDVLYGDVNGDGQISLTDVLRLRRYLANRDENGNCDVVVDKGADVNGDGDIDLIDVLRLRKYMADRDPVTGESSVVLGPQQ